MGRPKKNAGKYRTKSSTKDSVSELSAEKIVFLENLDKQYQSELASYRQKKEECIEKIESYIALLKDKIGDKVGNTKLSDIFNAEPIEPESRTRRRSNSCSSFFSTSEATDVQAMGCRQPQGQIQETPANQPIKFNRLITPKISQDDCFAMMRYPKQGEWTLSMDGSPLIAPSVVPGGGVNMNIPTGDGNILSILPQPGRSRGAIPVNLPPETKFQLKAIYNHLKTFLQDDDDE